ncbi:MAG: ABC transporter permease [Marinifilaceae bacterium]
MNLELFIANRILSKESDNKSISRPIVKIAIIGIAIGLCVMILSVSIVIGFQKEISDKITGFGSDIQLTNFDNNNTFESEPLYIRDSIKNEIEKIDGVKHTQVFATKPGILKTKDEIQGIILNGTSTDFDPTFLKNNLIKGEFYTLNDSVKSNNCVISMSIANMMNIDIGDNISCLFIQQPARVRRFYVSGIYNSGMQEFDEIFVFCDIRHIQKLNNWNKHQYSGLEIILNDIKDIDKVYPKIGQIASMYSGEKQTIRTRSIKSKYPHLFDWIDMLDMNVWIILALMTSVSGINMISGLLILILEKTNMIGILKALGHKDIKIRKLFIYISAKLILKGMFWGNIVGISLALIQKYGQVIKLNPLMYNVSTVPINLNFTHILLLNIGTLLITVLILVLPSMIISKISPVKAIKFE